MSNNPAFGISLAELFAKRIFRIPDYQRGYAWGERQLMELWQDIEDIENLTGHGIMMYHFLFFLLTQWIRRARAWPAGWSASAA